MKEHNYNYLAIIHTDWKMRWVGIQRSVLQREKGLHRHHHLPRVQLDRSSPIPPASADSRPASAARYKNLREVLARVVKHRCSVLIMACWRITSHLSSCSDLEKDEKCRMSSPSDLWEWDDLEGQTNCFRIFRIE